MALAQQFLDKHIQHKSLSCIFFLLNKDNDYFVKIRSPQIFTSEREK